MRMSIYLPDALHEQVKASGLNVSSVCQQALLQVLADGGCAEAIDTARDIVRDAGFVVLKEKSYRQAQERQRIAEALLKAAKRDAESSRTWARGCLEEERYLRERCTFLYGAAERLGATREELRGFFTYEEWMAKRTA